MPEPASLQEFLTREFGVDLPIRGGPGTQAAPIVVTTTDLQQAVDVQIQVLQLLAKARRVAWRLTAQEVVAHVGRTVQTTIDTVAYANSQVVTQREAIHFLLEALPDDGTSIALPMASGFVDSRSGVQLPHQLGWLHLQSAIDNESASPGLGWSVAYTALTLQGTVQIYDRGARLTSEDVEAEPFITEFGTAVADALAVSPGALVKHQAVFRDASGRGQCLLAILDVPGDSMSAVLLTVLNGCFVKARLTFDATERQFGQMAHESMEAFVAAIRPGPTKSS